MIRLLQGTNFQYKVPNASCQLVASDGLNKIIVSDILEEGGEIFLTASAETTQSWNPTRYNYQIIGPEGLVEEGVLKVKANLLFTNTTDSYWAQVVKACEAKLAGRAEELAYHVSVGDKSITQLSIDECLKLLNFAKNKLAEEEAEEEGVEPWSRINRWSDHILVALTEKDNHELLEKSF